MNQDNIETITDVEIIPPETEEKPRPKKGRGGTNNFGTENRKNMNKTEEGREAVKQMLRETLDAYRQPKVNSVEELAQRWDKYFDMCSQTGQIPTIEEMCLYSGYTYKAVYDWEHTGYCSLEKSTGFEITNVIKKAKEFVKSFDAKAVNAGKLNFLAYCFRAKNYYGMTDVQQLQVVNDKPLGEDISPEEIAEKYKKSLPEVQE